MTFLEHMSGIDEMVTQMKQNLDNYSMLAASAGDSNGVGVNFAGTGGVLRADSLGNVFAGNSIMSIGRINSYGNSGALHVDALGQMRVGDNLLVSEQF